MDYKDEREAIGRLIALVVILWVSVLCGGGALGVQVVARWLGGGH